MSHSTVTTTSRRANTGVTTAVSIILPTYNERESLPRVVREIHESLGAIPHEIVVSDDDSPDGTWQWVTQEGARDASLRLVHRRANPGLSEAVLDGFRAATGEQLIVMDADGQHDPSVLPAICRALTQYDLVVGSRYAAGGSTGRWSLSRWFTSRAATWLAQLILNVRLSDPMSGYFGVRRAAFERVAPSMNAKGFKILLELCYRLSKGHAHAERVCVEVPYTFRGRVAGKSKLSSRVMWQYVRMLATLRKEEPLPQGLPRFLAVGAMGTVVNCASLWELTNRFHWPFWVASVAAIQLSTAHNFVLHDRWTFKGRRGHERWLTRFWHFEVATFAGMLVNWTVLSALVAWAGVSLLTANLCGIAAGTVLNFVMSKLWAWKPIQCASTSPTSG